MIFIDDVMRTQAYNTFQWEVFLQPVFAYFVKLATSMHFVKEYNIYAYNDSLQLMHFKIYLL